MSTTPVLRMSKEITGFWGNLKVALSRRTEGRGLILFLVIGAVISATQPLVFTAYSVTLGRIALIGLVALGLTAVILLGELDLSVASNLALSGVIVAAVGNATGNLLIGVLAALASSFLIAVVNTFFVAIVGINSFIATLGMLFVIRGFAIVLSDEQPIKLENVDFGILFGQPIIGPITPRILIFLLVFAAIQIFVARIRIGREFFAVGGNRQAAYDAGIPVKRRIFLGFIISSAVASIAGIVNTLERTAADPTAGSTVLLASFAAAIIGGNYLKGGRGSIIGTLIGASALGMLQVALTISGVQVPVQEIYIGGILLIAVITDPSSLRAVWGSLRATLLGRLGSQERKS